jgi:hypothetical protein
MALATTEYLRSGHRLFPVRVSRRGSAGVRQGSMQLLGHRDGLAFVGNNEWHADPSIIALDFSLALVKVGRTPIGDAYANRFLCHGQINFR